MKNTLILGLVLGFQVATAFADADPFVVLEGRVQNFNERSVDLTLENGTEVQIPRKRITEKTDLRPGSNISAVVLINDIQAPLVTAH